MRTLDYRRYDSFAPRPLRGNPAAVVLLQDWLPDERLAAIAGELNHWTAFVRPESTGWRARVFTIPPIVETALCGHALLASARCLFDGPAADLDRLVLITRDGEVPARPIPGGAEIDFPAIPVDPLDRPPPFAEAVGGEPLGWWKRREGYPAYIALFAEPEELRALPAEPDKLSGLQALVLATAPGTGLSADFASRLFQPMKSLIEDPAGGTQHALAGPFWAARLQRTNLKAVSLSARGGACDLVVSPERLRIAAPVAFAGEGRILLTD